MISDLLLTEMDREIITGLKTHNSALVKKVRNQMILDNLTAFAVGWACAGGIVLLIMVGIL